MSPAEIARRLSDRFNRLARRRAHERHRALHAAVTWSHDLLDDDERRVFRRLAVFPATFDLAAAEAIAGGDTPNPVDPLLHLVDRSLVVYDPADARYRLLETLRQYAADRLADAAETSALRDRHATHYTALATSRPDTLLDAELYNFRAVVARLDEQDRTRDILDLCHAQIGHISMTAPAEMRGWYERVLSHEAALSPQERVDTLGELGQLALTTGHNEGHGRRGRTASHSRKSSPRHWGGPD
jgi:predicted ATPase